MHLWSRHNMDRPVRLDVVGGEHSVGLLDYLDGGTPAEHPLAVEATAHAAMVCRRFGLDLVFPVKPAEFLGHCRVESGCGLDRELEADDIVSCRYESLRTGARQGCG